MNLITPDSGLLFWMVLIFAIVFFILAKFGFPIITGSVRKREAHIAESLQKAAQAQKTFESMDATCRKMLDDTASQQAQMLEQARAASTQMVEDAKTRAAAEGAAMIERAREEIATQQKEALRELQNVVVEMSVAVSEKILRGKLTTSAEQMDQINRWVEDEINSGAAES